MSPYTSYLVETFVTLLVVCAVAFVVLYGARRMGMGRPLGGIELVARLPLDARRSIVLVRVGAQVFLVGVGEGGFTRLGKIPASDVPASAAREPLAFSSALARAFGRQEKKGEGRT